MSKSGAGGKRYDGPPTFESGGGGGMPPAPTAFYATASNGKFQNPVISDFLQPSVPCFIWGFTSLSTLYRYITTGSWKGRGIQYIQFARVLYCKLPTDGKQLPAFPHKALTGIEPRPQRWEAPEEQLAYSTIPEKAYSHSKVPSTTSPFLVEKIMPSTAGLCTPFVMLFRSLLMHQMKVGAHI